MTPRPPSVIMTDDDRAGTDAQPIRPRPPPWRFDTPAIGLRRPSRIACGTAVRRRTRIDFAPPGDRGIVANSGKI
ncbi:hypothetical protein [Burkholderia sp.]|uniref:hypothetical protein n=1 Tax=Burkholderia sp. TaxID=36773 RepID=UPI0025BB651B|nr:hypothetical protein [Burkholderia sp.]MBS6362102.1 hypothetical protein [Burkholderia sp.]